MGKTKSSWQEVVTSEDLDAHMIEIGQVEANAYILTQLLQSHPPRAGLIYVPGCGTGQIFDFVNLDLLKNYEFLFSDIKRDFLNKLENRLSSKLKFQAFTEDVEETSVHKKVEAILAILLLEHVDWRLALSHLLRTNPEYIFVIIQVHTLQSGVVNTNRQLRPSIKLFSETARPELVAPEDLVQFLASMGFQKVAESSKEVPDNKRMLGLCFKSKAESNGRN